MNGSWPAPKSQGQPYSQTVWKKHRPSAASVRLGKPEPVVHAGTAPPPMIVWLHWGPCGGRPTISATGHTGGSPGTPVKYPITAYPRSFNAVRTAGSPGEDGSTSVVS